MPTTSAARRRGLRAATLSVVLAVAVGGCQLTEEQEPEALPSPTLSAKPLPEPTESESAAAADGLERYYTQDVEWT
ncbi:MAG TPA: hypothetical protein VFR87_05000, partial [Nocardioidaceae bacterium]|nr:hypothetical protein [Nocardioidaceae bacterium]